MLGPPTESTQPLVPDPLVQQQELQFGHDCPAANDATKNNTQVTTMCRINLFLSVSQTY